MRPISATARDAGAVPDTTNGFDRMKRVRNENGLTCKDNILRELLCRKDVLPTFLRTYVDEFKDCSTETILDCIPLENDTEHVHPWDLHPDIAKGDGMDTDVLFRTRLPQSDEFAAVYLNFDNRNKYDPLSDIEVRTEMLVSEIFDSMSVDARSGQNDERIGKVYSIWIIPNTPGYDPSYIVRYDRKPDVVYGKEDGCYLKLDLTTIKIIYIGKNDRGQPDPLNLPTVLFDYNVDSDERYRTLSHRYGIELSEEEKYRLDLVLGHMRYYDLGVESYRKMAKTEEQARGRAEGVLEATLETLSKCVASNVTRYGITVEKAMDDFDVADDIRDEVRRRAEAILNG